MSEAIFRDLINYPYEERNLEFKESVSWQNSRIKAKITKSILALANLRDGGWIVIGKEEQPDRSFKPIGMTQDDFNSFDPDIMKDSVKEYADPYVDFSIRRFDDEGKKFILIQVKEFDALPIICKRDWGNILHRGQIYTRSRAGKPESIAVPSQSEMREIINMAVEKEIRHFREHLSLTGLLPSIPAGPSDNELFDKQLGGLV